MAGPPRIRHADAADAEAIAHIMIDANQHAFRGRVPDQCLNWITPHESATNWRRTIGPGGMRDGDCLLVAEATPDGVVGFALGRAPQQQNDDDDDDHDHGELSVIAVAPAFQRHGIGRLLVSSVAKHLIRFGVRSMRVHVLSANPNCRFYERLGARFVRDQPRDWNGVVLPESVYEWKDLSALVAPQS